MYVSSTEDSVEPMETFTFPSRRRHTVGKRTAVLSFVISNLCRASETLNRWFRPPEHVKRVAVTLQEPQRNASRT